ncbi:MAG: hypothetical protein IJZ00_01620 [Lachnospiraceae bacterium]|nr:hypothetical protein [Lachnospiraceae bacterium]
MKKKKIIITSIIATLLLAGLLFYWNNNEVHVCEAVSLEEAREILTEENVLLEYVCWGDSYSFFDLTQKNRAQLYSGVSGHMVICKNGWVYYCSFLPQEEVISMYRDDVWEKVQYENAQVYNLGKISSLDLLLYKVDAFFVDRESQWNEECYRNGLDVDEPQESMGNYNYYAEGTTNNSLSERNINIYEMAGTTRDIINYSCYVYQREEGKIKKEMILYEGIEERGYSLDYNAINIIMRLKKCYSFEQYIAMALKDIYTNQNLRIEERYLFESEGNIESGEIALFEQTGNNMNISIEEDNVYYNLNGQWFQTTKQNFFVGETGIGILEEGVQYILPLDEKLVYVCNGNYGNGKGKIYLYENGESILLLEEYESIKIKAFENYLYCSDYRSLIRLDPLGTAEILWEHAVYAFTVDENYIYIFDGNTWQMLDRETGEDLGYIATDIYFAYEMDELYAAGGKLYFAAWNRENNTISCNSLDMEGNLTQIGEVHSGTEADSYRVAAHEEYLFYSTEQGESLVRVNINTGEETIVQMDEYGVVYAGDLIMADDSLVVYWRDEERRDCYSFLDVESLEVEAEVCLE